MVGSEKSSSLIIIAWLPWVIGGREWEEVEEEITEDGEEEYKLEVEEGSLLREESQIEKLEESLVEDEHETVDIESVI